MGDKISGNWASWLPRLFSRQRSYRREVHEHLSKINSFLFPYAAEYEKLGPKRAVALGFQHAFAMSCATILVPLLTGLDVGVALFCAGVGTLIFHLCTGGRMPTFLGSSFAFISALAGVIGNSAFGATKDEQIAAAMGGVIVAGAFYLVLALIIRIFGKGLIDKLFPPVVRGVGITLIGLNLSSSAISNIQTQYGADGSTLTLFGEGFSMSAYVWGWVIAAIVCLLAVLLSSCGKGMVKMSSIVIALTGGYLFTLLVTKTGLAPAALMDTSVIADYGWVQAPHFVLPRFDLTAIGMIAPIAIVTCVEHVGDVYANGEVVGKKFYDDPGPAPHHAGGRPGHHVRRACGRPARTPPTRRTPPSWRPRATTTPPPCASRPSSPLWSASSARPSA
mgnify:CR=1 FL=1